MNPPIRSYRDLTVWRRAVELFVGVTKLARKLPPTDRMVFEVQIRKAARSVSSNISEGHQRQHLGDYLRSLSFAKGSLGEVETDLVLIEKTCVVPPTELAVCVSCADEVGKMLTVLSRNLRKQWRKRDR